MVALWPGAAGSSGTYRRVPPGGIATGGGGVGGADGSGTSGTAGSGGSGGSGGSTAVTVWAAGRCVFADHEAEPDGLCRPNESDETERNCGHV